jgi:hypothetical protein
LVADLKLEPPPDEPPLLPVDGDGVVSVGAGVVSTGAEVVVGAV